MECAYKDDYFIFRAVYRLDINNDNNVTVVSELIFARLTDIRVFEKRLPLSRKLADSFVVVYRTLSAASFAPFYDERNTMKNFL